METALKEATEKLKAKQSAVKALLEEGRTGGESFSYDNIKSVENPVDALRLANSELEEAGADRDKLKVVHDADETMKRLGLVDSRERPLNTGPGGAKSLGKRFTEWEGYTGRKGLSNGAEMEMPDLTMKALFDKPPAAGDGEGWEPYSPRLDLVVGFAHRPVQLLDRIRQIPIALETARYMEQTVRDPVGGGDGAAIADTVEGAVYTDTGFEWQERSKDVHKKGVYLEATEEQFADVPGVEDMIAMQMPTMLAEAVDHDLVNRAGNAAGSANGLLSAHFGGSNVTINGIARASDQAVLNAILEGIEYVEHTGRANADLVLMNTRDYYRELGRQDTDGRYIISNPNSGMVEFRPWGIMAVKVDSLPAGTCVVGDFGMYAQIRDRQDVRVRWAPAFSTPSGGGTYRPTGKLLIYCDIRCTFLWTRKAAFTSVTGLA